MRQNQGTTAYELYALSREDRDAIVGALQAVGDHDLANAIADTGGRWGWGKKQFIYDFVNLCNTYELGSREAVCTIIRLLKFSAAPHADGEDC
jgi:hypothetical protein